MTHIIRSIQIPPESTGPKIAVQQRKTLQFDNETLTLKVGDIIVGGTSAATGTITGIEREGYAIDAGLLFIDDYTGTFINNEAINVGVTQYALVDTTSNAYEEVNVQKNVIVDPNNLSYGLSIDELGAGVVKFKDGHPTLGGFGSLQVGQSQVIKQYRFAYDEDATTFWDQETSGATISYETNTGCILLQNPTTSGALASRTSNFYHPYVPGVGQLVEMTIQIGDAGKTNVRRRWGYFDDDNGVYFELNGTDLNLVVRSNTTGSVVNTVIDRNDWNVDKLDGNGKSNLNIDVTKGNIYYIDFQWLGAGRVRFGVILPDGSKQVMHVVEHVSTANLPYMRTGTLPIRIEQDNTGTASSSSEMRWACGAVKYESYTPINAPRASGELPLKLLQVSDGETYIGGFRPKLQLNGLTNRSLARFIALNLINANNAGMVRYKVYSTDSSNITGAAFANVSTSSVLEVDSTGTAITTPAAAKRMLTYFVEPNGSLFIQNFTGETVHDIELFLGANSSFQPALVVTAENIGTANTQVGLSTNWMEIKA